MNDPLLPEGMPEPGTITRLLNEARQGEGTAWNNLFDLIYPYLRDRASYVLQQERKEHTFQPTDLVHEAFLRLVYRDHASAQNRAHFLAICSQCMRRILVDHARARLARKRGGNKLFVRLSDIPDIPAAAEPDRIVMLNLALEKLEGIDESRARLVEMRLFAGLSLEEAASVLGMNYSTTRRRWEAVRVWLQRELTG